jgi:hypothetical protein
MGTAVTPLAKALLCAPLIAGLVSLRSAAAVNEVDLIPAERAAWTPKNVAVGITSMLGGWNYWYAERTIQIETVPTDAELGLYYIRSNFQKRFERSRSPANVKLPPRVDMTSRDAVKFHAISDGYLAEEVSFDASSVPEKVVIQLRALPNSLVFLGHTALAGRTSLMLRTTEQPELRMSKSSKLDGFQIALTKTALKLPGTPSPGGHMTGIEAVQLGEDAILRVQTDQPDLEVRSKESFDAVQSQYVYMFDIVPANSVAPSDGQIRSRLDSLAFAPDPNCDDRYADVLRQRVGDSDLADAFRPSGELADLYRREAMLRLGRFHDGTVKTDSGDTLHTGSSLELALAMQSAARVHGYLALLGALARSEPVPADALRSLVAPGRETSEFAPIYEAAEAMRRDCHR